MRTPDQILADLAAVVQSTFPDRDFSAPIGPDTRAFADLGMASIDLVVLAEKLEGYYGKRLPFGQFLNGLRTRGADDVGVGELVAFLHGCMV